MKPSAEKVCKCLTFSGQLMSLPWYPVKGEENGYDCLITGVILFQTGRPPPSLQALTVEREVSNDDDEFGGSDDEIGDEESQQTSGIFSCHQYYICTLTVSSTYYTVHY